MVGPPRSPWSPWFLDWMGWCVGGEGEQQTLESWVERSYPMSFMAAMALGFTMPLGLLPVVLFLDWIGCVDG